MSTTDNVTDAVFVRVDGELVRDGQRTALPPHFGQLLFATRLGYRGRTTTVEFRVRDAGAAVSGARVRAGGKSGTTNGRGRVELRLPGRAVTATATKAGYAKDTLRVKTR